MQSRRKRVTAGPEGVLMMMQEANKQKGRGKGNTLLKAARGLYSLQHTWHDAEGRSRVSRRQSPGRVTTPCPKRWEIREYELQDFGRGWRRTPWAPGNEPGFRGSTRTAERSHYAPESLVDFDVVITWVHMASEPWKHGDCSGNTERPSA